MFQSVIEKPIAGAKNFADRLPASHNFIRFLCVSGRFEEALRTCFSILSEFGEDFPEQVTPDAISSEIEKTGAMLANFPKNDLFSLPSLTDSTRLWMMKTMGTAMLILFSTKPESAPLVGCRMVQSSLTHGWCSDSAFGLYSFGQGLISVPKNVEEGCFW